MQGPLGWRCEMKVIMEMKINDHEISKVCTELESEKYLGLAIIVPIIFHGSYNFMCSYNWYYALSIVAIGFIFALLLHRNLKLHQKEKNKEHEDKKI